MPSFSTKPLIPSGKPAVNPRLRRLLDTGELDWDDFRHREMYLREWVNKGSEAFRDDGEYPVGQFPGDPEDDPDDDA